MSRTPFLLIAILAACADPSMSETLEGAVENGDARVVPAGDADTHDVNGDVEARAAVCAAVITHGWLRNQTAIDPASFLAQCGQITLQPDRRTYSTRDYPPNSSVPHTRGWDAHFEVADAGFDVNIRWGWTNHLEGWSASVTARYSATAANEARDVMQRLVGQTLPQLGFEMSPSWPQGTLEQDVNARIAVLIEEGTLAAGAKFDSAVEVKKGAVILGTIVAVGAAGQGKLLYYDVAGHYLASADWPTLYSLPGWD